MVDDIEAARQAVTVGKLTDAVETTQAQE